MWHHGRKAIGLSQYFQLPPLSVHGSQRFYLQSWPGVAVRKLHTHHLLRLVAWVYTLFVARSTQLTWDELIMYNAVKGPYRETVWTCIPGCVVRSSLCKVVTVLPISGFGNLRYQSDWQNMYTTCDCISGFIPRSGQNGHSYCNLYSVLTSYDTIWDLIQTKRGFTGTSCLH